MSSPASIEETYVIINKSRGRVPKKKAFIIRRDVTRCEDRLLYEKIT